RVPAAHPVEVLLKFDYHQVIVMCRSGPFSPPFLLSALLALVASACGDASDGAAAPGDAASGGPMDVAVTVAPQTWLVESIGGEHVRVQAAVAPGESPETFQPTDAAANRLLRAQLYFRIGVPAENGPWFEAVARRVQVVDLRPGAGEHDHAARLGTESHRHDPHAWLSPTRLRTFAGRVADALTAADPARADAYAAGLAETLAQLDALDAEIRDLLGPHRGRVFLIYHPAWGHFAAEYGLVQLAVEIDGQSPSDAELTRIRGLAVEHRCRAIFVQPQISDRIARRLGESLDVPVVVLDPLDEDLPGTLRGAARELAASFADPAGP
ncbi:MAG: zinc ABC transporter substrate-binding protein, partial [Acidobacteriota bacterium]